MTWRDVVAVNTTTPARDATPTSKRVNFFIMEPPLNMKVVETIYCIHPIRSDSLSGWEYTTGENANLLHQSIDRYLGIRSPGLRVSERTRPCRQMGGGGLLSPVHFLDAPTGEKASGTFLMRAPFCSFHKLNCELVSSLTRGRAICLLYHSRKEESQIGQSTNQIMERASCL